MKIKKLYFLFIAVFFYSVFVARAQIYSPQQIIKADHWVYDAISTLYLQTGRVTIADIAPISVAELRIYLKKIDIEKLSESGKTLYQKTYDFLYSDAFKFNFSGAFMGFNLQLEPEFLVKSNSDMDWSFATDYTGGTSEDTYGNTSTFSASDLNKPFVKLPIYLGWGDYFIIETNPMLAKSYWGMSKTYNFTNIFYNTDDMDFLWPQDAYGSAGYAFDRWGFNVSVGKQGLQIGRTQMGSVIYNNSFETDSYFQLNLYSQYMKYNLDVVQLEKDKFMYLHAINVSPFKWVKTGVVEASLVDGPFELRFLNPIMIMHSFGAWADYDGTKEHDVYGESHFCAYMGIFVDIVPCKNVRIYGLYAQNEIQPPNELSGSGVYIPDGFGIQLGTEVTIPHQKEGFFVAGLEGIYTTPFMYYKHSPDWSLSKKRYDMQDHCSSPLYSWVGSPYGPDCIGGQASLKYENLNKWSCTFSYLFIAHGTNSFGLYSQKDENGFYSYYPRAEYGLLSDSEKTDERLKAIEDKARSHSLTGTVSYNNQITLKGYYVLNKHIRFDASFSYLFSFNYKNEDENFQQGIEFATSIKYNLF